MYTVMTNGHTIIIFRIKNIIKLRVNGCSGERSQHCARGMRLFSGVLRLLVETLITGGVL